MDDGQGSYVMDKREARKEFKLRTTPKGIFAVRCLASGDVWVSATDHLDSARNGVWFQLRNGLHQNKTLQAVWNAHGEGGFEFEVLETLPEDVSSVALGDLLRERQKHWQAKLHALPLYP